MTVSLGTVSRVLNVLGTARTWEGSPTIDVFRRLLAGLETEQQRSDLPEAIGEALLVLRLDDERLRLALDVIVEFDLFEATSGVARLVREVPSPEVLVRAARLATHPGSSDLLGELVGLIATSPSEADSALSRSIAHALDPTLGSISTADHLSRISIWPGLARAGDHAPVLIAIDESAGTASGRLELALEAREAGARVRRLPRTVSKMPLPPWLGQSSPVLVDSESTVETWWSSLPHGETFNTRGVLGPANRSDLLRKINRTLPSQGRLRLSSQPESDPRPSPFDEVDAFLDGAFRGHEMAFLAGVPKSAVYRLSKTATVLKPVAHGGQYYWSFPTLVGIRAWNYVGQVTRRRQPDSLAADFVRMAMDERKVPIAVTGAGDILMEIEPGGGYADRRGQITSDVFFVHGAISAQFELGGHRTVPDLLRPTSRTQVDPAVIGGSPVVNGSRVSVEAVGALAERARSDGLGGTELAAFVGRKYPEVAERGLYDEVIGLAAGLAAFS